MRTDAYMKYLGLLSPLNRMEADEWWNEYGNVRFMIRLYGSKEIKDFMDETHKNTILPITLAQVRIRVEERKWRQQWINSLK